MKLRSFILTLGMAGVVVVLAGYLLQRYVSIFAIAFGYLFVFSEAIAWRLDRGRFVVYNSAFIFLALGFSELVLQLMPLAPGSYYEGTYDETYFVEDPDLGYAISPKDHVVESIKRSASDDSIIYDVRYTIDEHGLRKTLPKDSDEAVFFFGCSFTFGEGVNDEDALPQVFSNISGHRAANFGVHGYSAHQMLRALEIDRPKMIGRSNPLAVVYTMLPPDHIIRTAGRAHWDKHGPRYELINGEATYVGRFVERGWLPPWLDRIMSKSLIYDAVYNKYLPNFVTEGDRRRFLAIVLKARELSLSKYHAPFVVILWDVPSDRRAEVKWIAQHLKQNKVPTLQLSTSLPGLEADDYYIPVDGHPNGKANVLVARALSSFLATSLPAAHNELVK